MPYATRWQPLAVLGLALLPFLNSGCQRCGDSESPPPHLGFALSTDTLGTASKGFRKAEAFSAYVVFYGGPDFSQPLDTVRATKQPSNFYYVDRTMFCNLAIPSNGARSSEPRSYRLAVPAAGRRYDISDAVLQYGGADECTRSLDRLDVLVNTQRVDVRRGYTLTK